jgi:Bacterial SH3 domain
MRIRYVFPFFIFLGILLVAGAASTQDEACQALTEQVFATLAQNCSNLESNSVCYGAGGVNAVFASGANNIAQLGDEASVSDLQIIQSEAVDLTSGKLGAALMNLQADVPSAITDPAVTLLILGGVQVENAVSPEQAILTVPPIEVVTLLAANLRSGPSTNASVITSAKSGTTLIADALSGDKAWLRVLFEDTLAWVNRDLVGTEGDLDSLPALSADSLAPMQKFYLQAAGDSADCGGSGMIVIQGPENIPVNLNINGAEVRLSSTMVVRITSDNKMQVLVLSGAAYIGNLSIPAGFTISAPLSADGKSLAGAWENLQPLSSDQLEQLQFLSALPVDGMLHYAISIPTQEQIQTTLASLRGGAGGTASSGPAAGNVNCSRFGPTSPLGGMQFGPTTFFWDAAPGATTYRLNVFGESGQLLDSFTTTSDNPALSIDTNAGIIGSTGGSNFSWNVDALFNGQLACSSSSVAVVRDAFPVVVGGGGAEPTATPVGWSP